MHGIGRIVEEIIQLLSFALCFPPSAAFRASCRIIIDTIGFLCVGDIYSSSGK